MDRTAILFATRCAAASALSYALAVALSLQQPLWAAMSAVIVSQEDYRQTRSSGLYGVAAAAIGATIAVAAGEAGAAIGAPLTLDIAVGVGVAALLVHRWPALRSAMWTTTLVLVLSGDTAHLPEVALRRAAEFALGALIGWGAHALFYRLAPPR